MFVNSQKNIIIFSMKKFIILSVSDSWHHFEIPIFEYKKRLQKELEIVHLKPCKSGEIETIKKTETINIVSQLQKYNNALIVLCDEHGKTLWSTLETSQWIDKNMQKYKQIVFLIWWSYGFDTRLLQPHIHTTIRFTDWTLPHWLATLLLLEQIYRDLSILSGGKYHHE